MVVYLDNTLITGEMDEEHLQIMDEVLQQLETVALQAKKTSMVPLVTYLGHQIDSEGLHLLQIKSRLWRGACSSQCAGAQVLLGTADILW